MKLYIIIFVVAIIILTLFVIVKNKSHYKINTNQKSMSKLNNNLHNKLTDDKLKGNSNIQDLVKYSAFRKYIGKGYNLSEINYKNINTVGSSVIIIPNTTQIDDILKTSTESGTEAGSYHFDSRETFVDNFYSQTDASITILSYKVDASLKIGREFTKDTFVSSWMYSGSTDTLKISFANNNYALNDFINPSFISDLNMLVDSTINLDVNQYDYDWYLFDIFTKKWGTHIVNGVGIGAKYEKIYCLASETEETKDMLQISLQIEGSFPGIDFKAKTDVDQVKLQKLMTLEVIETNNIIGGDANSRGGMLYPMKGDNTGADVSTDWQTIVTAFLNSTTDSPGIVENYIMSFDDLIFNIKDCTYNNGAPMYNQQGYTNFIVKLKYYYDKVLTPSNIDISKIFLATIKNKFSNEYMTNVWKHDGGPCIAYMSPAIDQDQNQNQYQLYYYQSGFLTNPDGGSLSTRQDGTYGVDIAFGYRYNYDNWVFKNDGTIRLQEKDSTGNVINENMCLSYVSDKDKEGNPTSLNGKVILDIYKGDPKQKWEIKNTTTVTPPKVSCKPVDMNSVNEEFNITDFIEEHILNRTSLPTWVLDISLSKIYYLNINSKNITINIQDKETGLSSTNTDVISAKFYFDSSNKFILKSRIKFIHDSTTSYEIDFENRLIISYPEQDNSVKSLLKNNILKYQMTNNTVQNTLNNNNLLKSEQDNEILLLTHYPKKVQINLIFDKQNYDINGNPYATNTGDLYFRGYIKIIGVLPNQTTEWIQCTDPLIEKDTNLNSQGIYCNELPYEDYKNNEWYDTTNYRYFDITKALQFCDFTHESRNAIMKLQLIPGKRYLGQLDCTIFNPDLSVIIEPSYSIYDRLNTSPWINGQSPATNNTTYPGTTNKFNFEIDISRIQLVQLPIVEQYYLFFNGGDSGSQNIWSIEAQKRTGLYPFFDMIWIAGGNHVNCPYIGMSDGNPYQMYDVTEFLRWIKNETESSTMYIQNTRDTPSGDMPIDVIIQDNNGISKLKIIFSEWTKPTNQTGVGIELTNNNTKSFYRIKYSIRFDNEEGYDTSELSNLYFRGYNIDTDNESKWVPCTDILEDKSYGILCPCLDYLLYKNDDKYDFNNYRYFDVSRALQFVDPNHVTGKTIFMAVHIKSKGANLGPIESRLFDPTFASFILPSTSGFHYEKFSEKYYYSIDIKQLQLESIPVIPYTPPTPLEKFYIVNKNNGYCITIDNLSNQPFLKGIGFNDQLQLFVLDPNGKDILTLNRDAFLQRSVDDAFKVSISSPKNITSGWTFNHGMIQPLNLANYSLSYVTLSDIMRLNMANSDDKDIKQQWELRSSSHPTTQPPITQPPITQPPITQPPITQPPITQPPITQPPITQPPTRYPHNRLIFENQEYPDAASPTSNGNLYFRGYVDLISGTWIQCINVIEDGSGVSYGILCRQLLSGPLYYDIGDALFFVNNNVQHSESVLYMLLSDDNIWTANNFDILNIYNSMDGDINPNYLPVGASVYQTNYSGTTTSYQFGLDISIPAIPYTPPIPYPHNRLIFENQDYPGHGASPTSNGNLYFRGYVDLLSGSWIQCINVIEDGSGVSYGILCRQLLSGPLYYDIGDALFFVNNNVQHSESVLYMLLSDDNIWTANNFDILNIYNSMDGDINPNYLPVGASVYQTNYSGTTTSYQFGLDIFVNI